MIEEFLDREEGMTSLRARYEAEQAAAIEGHLHTADRPL